MKRLALRRRLTTVGDVLRMALVLLFIVAGLATTLFALLGVNPFREVIGK